MFTRFMGIGFQSKLKKACFSFNDKGKFALYHKQNTFFLLEYIILQKSSPNFKTHTR